ncbi:MAG: enolase C-terminal domain-like protein, partial [Planctomycetota bacterium]|nr:enolase C-terminal domain-like protein [Planctomycetota bacterium]
MKISQIRAYHVAVDRIYNTRVAPAGGHGDGKEKSDYLLYTLITEDGLTGIGEISDIEFDWVTLSAGQLEEWLGDFLIGADPEDRAELTDRLKGSFPSEMKREQRMMLSSSLEMALLDLEGRGKEKPVCELLGGRVRDSVNVSWVIYIRSAEQMEDEVKDRIAEGFTAFKMKVGADLDLDEKRLQLFRDTAGDAEIKIDANGAWNVEQ